MGARGAEVMYNIATALLLSREQELSEAVPLCRQEHGQEPAYKGRYQGREWRMCLSPQWLLLGWHTKEGHRKRGWRVNSPQNACYCPTHPLTFCPTRALDAGPVTAGSSTGIEVWAAAWRLEPASGVSRHSLVVIAA